MKKKVKNLFIITGLVMVIGIIAQGCKKEGQVNLRSANVSDMKPEKFQKILNFISISWGVQKDKISYSSKKNEFSFNDIVFSKERIEAIYDSSNEYKLKHEQN